VLASAACHRGQTGAQGRARGVCSVAARDTIVVERAAAEFFEARVLGVTGGKLKVQTANEGEPARVVASDAYRVPGSPTPLRPREPGHLQDGPRAL